MKKIQLVLMLLISITGDIYAQQKNEGNPFDIPAFMISQTYYIELDKAEKIKLDLFDLNDLDAIGNLDSIIRIFIQDIEPLKDSIADELSIKRIDYIPDISGKSKIRIQRSSPLGSSFLINQGSVAALKLEQDTLNIILKAPGGSKYLFKNKSGSYHYFSISFYLNNLSNLPGYLDGRLEKQLEELKKNANKKWVRGNDGLMHAKAAPFLSTNKWRGQSNGSDYLNIRISSDIQNYKNNFVPSLSLSAIFVINRNFIKHEFSITGESHFTFEKNDVGKLETFRNTFLTIGYDQENNRKQAPAFGFTPSFSLGYLIRQRGTVYEKNTFRLGFGKASLFGNRLKIEPVIYFNNFFKGVTPGIRLSL